MGISFNPEKVRRKGQPKLDSSVFASFTQDPLETVREISVNQIDPWTDGDGGGQPFRLYEKEKLNDMVTNVREHGILNPCIVRPRNGRYQLIAGHNRTAAAKLAGLSVIPCIIKDVDDDQAALYMIDSNLFQRERILPSERARAYEMKLAIYRRRGERTDLLDAEPVNAAQRVAEEMGDSARSVQRYARLTKLTPELLELVDQGCIPITVGSKIAGFREEDQMKLQKALEDSKSKKISIAQVEEVKKAIEAQRNMLDEETVREIMSEKK